jgi:hypothetical protein
MILFINKKRLMADLTRDRIPDPNRYGLHFDPVLQTYRPTVLKCVLPTTLDECMWYEFIHQRTGPKGPLSANAMTKLVYFTDHEPDGGIPTICIPQTALIQGIQVGYSRQVWAEFLAEQYLHYIKIIAEVNRKIPRYDLTDLLFKRVLLESFLASINDPNHNNAKTLLTESDGLIPYFELIDGLDLDWTGEILNS